MNKLKYIISIVLIYCLSLCACISANAELTPDTYNTAVENLSAGDIIFPSEDFDINAIEETLYLLVFDEDGNQQKRIDTTVPAGANLKAYGPTGCDLILQSDGLYLEKGTYGPIPYLE